MAWIEFDAIHRTDIEKRYRAWGAKQPRQRNQIGSTMLSSVMGPFGEMEFPDEFVDELENSGISFKRR
jgi:hypothetical protein